MSDHWIILIPEDPQLVPDAERQERARGYCARIAPDADEIECVAGEDVQFFDCGESLSQICCPNCGGELSVESWQSWMDDDFGGGFRLETRRLPCCDKEATLKQLVYDAPQGFARFALQVMNSNLGLLEDAHKGRKRGHSTFHDDRQRL